MADEIVMTCPRCGRQLKAHEVYTTNQCMYCMRDKAAWRYWSRRPGQMVFRFYTLQSTLGRKSK